MADNLSPDLIEERISLTLESCIKRTDIEAFLAEFCKRNGLAEMRFDESGEITFSFGDELELQMAHSPSLPGIIVSVILPEELASRCELGRELLQANLSWAQNGGGTFGRVPSSGAFVFCRLITIIDNDVQRFERELLLFAAPAKDWLNYIELALDLDTEDGSSPRFASIRNTDRQNSVMFSLDG